MPKHYWFHCTACDWDGMRYRNVKKCPECGEDVVREPPVDSRTACYWCGSMNALAMFAHRNDAGAIVGWLFVCNAHTPLVADKDIKVELG